MRSGRSERRKTPRAAEDFHATRYAERYAALATSLGGRDDRLSGRERDVAGLVADGLTNRAIAERLVVSERTIETHVSSILRKLDVSSRTGIARRVIDSGS